jgi:hypothetical protein
MTADEFCAHYPKLYHMADENSFDGIMKHGLLSTSALLDLFEVREPLRSEIERKHRPKNITISHPKHGSAVIRDQKPMPEARLRKCLSDATPSEWYYLLNGFTFFWVREERLDRLLGGREYRHLKHCVFEVDSRPVIHAHEKDVFVTSMNTGNCLPYNAKRSPAKFVPLADCPSDWRRKSGAANSIVECAIRYGVPAFGSYEATMTIRRES